MSFLTDTAAGAGAGAGFTGEEGMSGVAPVGGAMTPGAQPMQSKEGLITQLANYLKDPATQQALGDVLKNYGKTGEAAQQLPPQAAQIVQQAIRSGGTMRPAVDPYLGDASKYMTPELAQTTLRRLGIPFGG
jgi:hypothetical protein